jgi:hypothetical protein
LFQQAQQQSTAVTESLHPFLALALTVVVEITTSFLQLGVLMEPHQVVRAELDLLETVPLDFQRELTDSADLAKLEFLAANKARKRCCQFS